MSVEDLEKILEVGGNVVTNLLRIEHLLRLAKMAKSSGAKLTIVGAASIESMLKIVAAGGGNVTWDVSNA